LPANQQDDQIAAKRFERALGIHESIQLGDVDVPLRLERRSNAATWDSEDGREATLWKERDRMSASSGEFEVVITEKEIPRGMTEVVASDLS